MVKKTQRNVASWEFCSRIHSAQRFICPKHCTRRGIWKSLELSGFRNASRATSSQEVQHLGHHGSCCSSGNCTFSAWSVPVLLCDELLFHSYTLCKILALLVLALRAQRALRAPRTLRTLSISNSRDSFLGLLPVCTLPATGVSSASRALAQKGSSWEQKPGILILLYK